MENCVDIYKRCDDANRRLCNQAFFTKIYVDEDDDLHVEYARPYEMLLDPRNQRQRRFTVLPASSPNADKAPDPTDPPAH